MGVGRRDRGSPSIQVSQPALLCPRLQLPLGGGGPWPPQAACAEASGSARPVCGPREGQCPRFLLPCAGSGVQSQGARDPRPCREGHRGLRGGLDTDQLRGPPRGLPHPGGLRDGQHVCGSGPGCQGRRQDQRGDRHSHGHLLQAPALGGGGLPGVPVTARPRARAWGRGPGLGAVVQASAELRSSSSLPLPQCSSAWAPGTGERCPPKLWCWPSGCPGSRPGSPLPRPELSTRLSGQGCRCPPAAIKAGQAVLCFLPATPGADAVGGVTFY